jgi:RecA-family ATPase
MQQLANSVADGEPFMGIETSKMPVLCVLCEDDKQEIDRRQIDINRSRGIDDGFGAAPDNVYLWPRVGEDNIVVTFPNAGEDQPTNFYADLIKAVDTVKGDAEEICIILDNATDFFGGSENVRREVNTFIKSYCGSLCLRFNATVILLAHPSLSGLASGTGMSGSTAWENSVRSRSYLSRDVDMDDIRTLSRKKSNYSDINDDSDIKLVWEAGVLTLPQSEDAIARIEGRNVKRVILDAVDQAQKEGSPFKARSGRKVRNALPRIVDAWKKGVVMKAFHDLESDGFIVHETRKGYRVVNRPKWDVSY